MRMPFLIEQMLQKLGRTGQHTQMTAKEKWMLFFLGGLLLAVIVFPGGKKNVDSTEQEKQGEYPVTEVSHALTEAETSITAYERYLSETLEEILSQIEGAGEVKAWVTLASGKEQVFTMESEGEQSLLKEEDSVGGSRTEEKNSMNKSVVLANDGNPYVVKTLQPKVEGVLVVAEGADKSTVKKNISDAVEVLFGIDAHRIKVAKKKAEE